MVTTFICQRNSTKEKAKPFCYMVWYFWDYFFFSRFQNERCWNCTVIALTGPSKLSPCFLLTSLTDCSRYSPWRQAFNTEGRSEGIQDNENKRGKKRIIAKHTYFCSNEHAGLLPWGLLIYPFFLFSSVSIRFLWLLDIHNLTYTSK